MFIAGVVLCDCCRYLCVLWLAMFVVVVCGFVVFVVVVVCLLYLL